MKNRTKTFGYVVLIAGLALIFTGYFLFVQQEKRNNIFWLDLSVTCLIFIVTIFTELGLFGFNFDFEKQVGGLGIRLSYIRFYSFLAIVIIITCYLYHVNFRYQLFFQLLAGFLLLIGYFFSYVSSRKAVTVQIEQSVQRKGKEEILKAIGEFEILFSNDAAKFITEKQKIDTIKETARYLSPTNNDSANEIDSEIASNIQQAYALAKTNTDDKAEVFLLLNKCEELLKLRKNIYSN
jgi:hypothetical protein